MRPPDLRFSRFLTPIAGCDVFILSWPHAQTSSITLINNRLCERKEISVPEAILTPSQGAECLAEPVRSKCEMKTASVEGSHAAIRLTFPRSFKRFLSTGPESDGRELLDEGVKNNGPP